MIYIDILYNIFFGHAYFDFYILYLDKETLKIIEDKKQKGIS